MVRALGLEPRTNALYRRRRGRGLVFVVILVQYRQSLQHGCLIQVRVSGAHLDRLVAGQFLDDLQTDPSLYQSGAERVLQIVPPELLDLSATLCCRPPVLVVTDSEDDIRRGRIRLVGSPALPLQAQRLDRTQRLHGFLGEVNLSGVSVLCVPSCAFLDLVVHVIPDQIVLLTFPHPRVERHVKLTLPVDHVLAQLFVPRATGIHILLENLPDPGFLGGKQVANDSVVDRHRFGGPDGVILYEIPLDPEVVNRGKLSTVPVLGRRFYGQRTEPVGDLADSDAIRRPRSERGLDDADAVGWVELVLVLPRTILDLLQ